MFILCLQGKFNCRRDSSKIIYQRSLDTWTEVVSFINFLTKEHFNFDSAISALYGMHVNYKFVQKTIYCLGR